ncbi:SDR family oxidoreductase [Bradyrhizobium ontarionense]|uniref:SDR family oxidoreductase n=1 Tax=Bradyrhizobium ontarionense TaxID=2898149 RepID=UPI0031F2F6CB
MSYHGADKVADRYNIMGLAKASVRCLAAELGDNNIGVCAVSLGPLLVRAASGITLSMSSSRPLWPKSPAESYTGATELD